MSPLAYLVIRAILSWAQLVERAERAFLSNGLVLVAVGAVHCWVVSYSLFVTVHVRAIRHHGYHEGYTEHVPESVAWTEMLTRACFWIWAVSGLTTAAVRIFDKDGSGLPVDVESNDKPSAMKQIMRSPGFHWAIGQAHAISCVGSFVGILMHCAAMAVMRGNLTVCELCLAAISVGFALPHSLLALPRLSAQADAVVRGALGQQTVQAAAAEAATLGPQLSIIFALGDGAGYAPLWMNVIYALAALGFLTKIGACARSPHKLEGAAVSAEAAEICASLAVDVMAALAIVWCFPHLNTWFLWACVGGVLAFAAAAALKLPAVRRCYLDWLDPLFVQCEKKHRTPPGLHRQALRRISWALALLCASTALWGIQAHKAAMLEVHNSNALAKVTLPSYLMLRVQHGHDLDVVSRLRGAAAEALDLDSKAVYFLEISLQHRLAVFECSGHSGPSTDTTQASEIRLGWQAAVRHPENQLADIADSSFPSVLSAEVCSEIEDAEGLASGGLAGQIDGEARAAREAACAWYWHRVITGAGKHAGQA